METGTYEAEILCHNCKHIDKADIPLGTTIGIFVTGKICKTCGCEMIPRNPRTGC